jgi:hypothetical protein
MVYLKQLFFITLGPALRLEAVACRVVTETVTENSNDKSRDCNPCNRYLDLTDADQCARVPGRFTCCAALSD